MNDSDITLNPTVENNCLQLPPAVMSPNKGSKNANIKERLNLHVKRRLQENTDVPGTGVDPLSTSSSIAVPISPNSNVTSRSNIGNSGNKSTGGNIKRSDKLGIHGHGRGGKRSRTKHHNSSSLSSSVDDDCSRDGNVGSCNDPNTVTTPQPHTREKDTGPDLLTWVLNEKKLSLMKDPEVIKFLESIIITLGK